MRKKLFKFGRFIGLIVVFKVAFLCGLIIFFAGFTNVSTAYNALDKAIFERDLHLESFRNPRTFAEEIVAIKTIQKRTFAISPLGRGIPEYQTREPVDFLRRHEGLCFDRSRTTDKALSYIGLPSRHVYLLYHQKGKGFLSTLFQYRSSSHAVTEVKTSRGWMFIDSNTDWIALTRDGQVVNADDVFNRTAEFETIPSYLKNPWWAIRGMYSRRGQLYPPFWLFPNVNWPDLMYWLLVG